MKNLTASEIERLKGYNPTRYQTYLIKMNINGNMLYLTDRDAPVFYGGVYYQPGYITSDSVDEIEVTPELRQKGYDNKTTTDDHGMHIVGLSKDQNGKEYYIVKNSWGETNDYKGYLYMTKEFVKYKTTDIMLHKKGVPSAIAKKLQF